MAQAADIVIFKVIKKPLVVWLSQVIHKVVIQNPVRSKEAMWPKKWLLLDEDIISNCPSEKAPPQSLIRALNRCHLDRWAFIPAGIFLVKQVKSKESSNLFTCEAKERLNRNNYIWLSRVSQCVGAFDVKQSKRSLGTHSKETLQNDFLLSFICIYKGQTWKKKHFPQRQTIIKLCGAISLVSFRGAYWVVHSMLF